MMTLAESQLALAALADFCAPGSRESVPVLKRLLRVRPTLVPPIR